MSNTKDELMGESEEARQCSYYTNMHGICISHINHTSKPVKFLFLLLDYTVSLAHRKGQDRAYLA
jgi:hypothetical protein